MLRAKLFTLAAIGAFVGPPLGGEQLVVKKETGLPVFEQEKVII